MISTSRSGFTLIELLVAMVLLVVLTVSLVGSSRVAAMSARRASMELKAAQLMTQELERLKTTPYAALVSGNASTSLGTSDWTVTDSASFRRVELVVSTHPIAGIVVTDTLYLYRIP